MASKLDCKKVAQTIKDNVKKEVKELGKELTLAVVLVGNDPASEVYVKNKEKVCEEVGIKSTVHKLPEDTTQEQLENLVKELNNDDSVTGILVQLPLPAHLNEQQAIDLIHPYKDVDGLTTHNQGLLALGRVNEAILPCTPKGVLTLMDSVGYDLEGKHVTVLGRSNLFGKPMSQLLLSRNATVTVCHSKTKRCDKEAAMQLSSVIISAIGQASKVKLTYYYPTDLVVDVGINRNKNGEIVGDVDVKTLPKKCKYTPVPGGVGLLTTATLLENMVECYKKMEQNK